MNFDYKKFDNLVDFESKVYLKKMPYPYAIFDNLFDEDLLKNVNKEIDQSSYTKDVRKISGIEVKTRSDFEDNESLPRYIRTVFEILNGGKFLKIISRLTGIDGLICDPYYDGGGVNIIENEGTLAVHVDGTHQHRMKICRRLNAILFLNETWDRDWNGYHEQWEFLNKDLSPFDDNQKWRCVRKILPIKNRLYIFTTNDHSWHGHAGKLSIPEDIKRKSLITYFYTSSRPKNDIIFDNPHRALFIHNTKTLKHDPFRETEIII